MKRLVIEEDNWAEFDENDYVRISGENIKVEDVVFENIGAIISDIPKAKFTKLKKPEKMFISDAEHFSGRLTNVAHFPEG